MIFVRKRLEEVWPGDIVSLAWGYAGGGLGHCGQVLDVDVKNGRVRYAWEYSDCGVRYNPTYWTSWGIDHLGRIGVLQLNKTPLPKGTRRRDIAYPNGFNPTEVALLCAYWNRAFPGVPLRLSKPCARNCAGCNCR